MNTVDLKHWRDRLRQDLWGSVMPFWASHSHDAQHGGFFNCLDQDGTVFDTTKHIWLQGRQCWMYARLASEFSEGEIAEFVAQYPSPPVTVAAGGPATPTPLTRSNLIAASKAGVDFLLQHAVSKDGEAVYFACARDGTPSAAQRKPFSAAFLTLALGELGVATGEARYRTLALHWLDKYLSWVNSPEGSGAALGKPGLAGAPALAPLNEPMITINLIRELSRGCATPEDARVFYAKERDAAVVALLEHVCREKKCVLEGVGAGGSTDFSSPAGRLINPGHGIEAGWFLLDLAEFLGDKELRAKSLEIIEWTFASGWDGEGGAPGSEPVNTAGQGSGGGSGGMIYFRDALGFTPTQLEAHSKLWWPQAESMIAFAMAFQASGGTDQVSWGRFTTVAEWTYKHLVTEKEWFGYADRTGVVTHRFKGGPYKGCFHVPRAIFLCERALTKVLAQQSK